MSVTRCTRRPEGSKAERKFALRAAEEALAAHRYTESLRHLDVARRAGASAAELKDYNAVQSEARSEDLYREMEHEAEQALGARPEALVREVDLRYAGHGGDAINGYLARPGDGADRSACL